MTRLLLASALFLASAVTAQADMIMKPSAHSVPVTIDRLTAAVEKAGAKVFARIDHAAGAAKVGAELAPNQMLMFGNPKLGTPAMQASATMGMDLPLRVVAFEDASGKVMIAYHDPADVAALHGLPADHPVIGKMQGALMKLTNAA
ncbi:MAG: DUF302 domain-containing protein, partial [Pseudomonadota bacterium]